MVMLLFLVDIANSGVLTWLQMKIVLVLSSLYLVLGRNPWHWQIPIVRTLTYLRVRRHTAQMFALYAPALTPVSRSLPCDSIALKLASLGEYRDHRPLYTLSRSRYTEVYVLIYGHLSNGSKIRLHIRKQQPCILYIVSSITHMHDFASLKNVMSVELWLKTVMIDNMLWLNTRVMGINAL